MECDGDMLGEIDGHYDTIYSLDLDECTFSTKDKFERFLSYLQRATGLKRLKLYGVKLKQNAVMSKKFLDIIQVNPITYIYLG